MDESVLWAVGVTLALGAAWVVRDVLRAVASELLELGADWLRPGGQPNRTDLLHLLAALGTSRETITQTAGRRVDQHSALMQRWGDHGEWMDSLPPDGRHHALDVRADIRRDIIDCRQAIVGELISPMAVPIWSSLQIHPEDGLPHLPGPTDAAPTAWTPELADLVDARTAGRLRTLAEARHVTPALVVSVAVANQELVERMVRAGGRLYHTDVNRETIPAPLVTIPEPADIKQDEARVE